MAHGGLCHPCARNR
ncbi:UNVERIFIED_CONTAM: hypothetical protein GTU68_060259 [Idotea baltica]|nr:hypothetical protein [Idotea baltica]